MNILGIETSCDETAASVVQDGTKVLSNVIASQIDIHAEYGGVVPEVAARSHLEVMLPVVQKALDESKMTWYEIDAIAVTQGPGLLGSLMIGTLTARTLSLLMNKPLVAVNHVVAHTYANFLIDTKPQFSLLALSVSGGHSHLLLFKNNLEWQLLGQTLDDAAGEAFDKVAKILGLPYPGGPSVGKAALKGDDHAFTFPKAKLGNDNLNFSFSGLKTAVLRQAQKEAGLDITAHSSAIADKLTERQKNDLAASFQRTVVETLVDKLELAAKAYSPKSVVIAGGVAANPVLREEVTKRLPFEMHYAPIELCTDNAAMIASLGYFKARDKQFADPRILHTDPSLAI